MAKDKVKSLNVGSIVKGKEGKSDYISVRKGITLVAHDSKGNKYTLGQYINLDNRKTMLESASRLEDEGKSKVAEFLRDRAEKMPEFVRFELRAKVEE